MHAEFIQKCDHEHDGYCDRCNSGRECLTAIETEISNSNLSDFKKEDLLWQFSKAKEAIVAYRNHIIR